MPCNDKPKIIHALENVVTTDTDHADHQEQLDESKASTTSHAGDCQKIAVVDGMVIFRSYQRKRHLWLPVKDLSVRFNDRLPQANYYLSGRPHKK